MLCCFYDRNKRFPVVVLKDYMKQHKDRTIFAFFKNKMLFGVLFLAIFAISFGFLSYFGFVPTELETTNDLSSVNPQEEIKAKAEAKGEEPLRIIIDAISVNSPIRNPNTTDIDALDEELTKGVVRYPGSGLAGQGNMLLFGHGSNLRVVNNKAYKVFTDIKNLKKGEIVKIIGKEKEYRYAVMKVTLITADKVLVDFSTKRNILTLSTCNTFGGHQERYVVETEFVGSSPLN